MAMAIAEQGDGAASRPPLKLPLHATGDSPRRGYYQRRGYTLINNIYWGVGRGA